MPNYLRPEGLAGCFRCAYVWRPRRRDPARCPLCKSKLWDVPKLRSVRNGKGLGLTDVILPRRTEFLNLLRIHHARNPRVFGSVARSEATASSDLDLLVDFDGDASAFDQVALQQDLVKFFRRPVDVAEPNGLHWLIRTQVLFEAIPA